MSLDGVRTTEMTGTPIADAFIVNRNGDTALQAVDDLARQLVGTGPLKDATAGASLGYQTQPAWAMLAAKPINDGQLGRVTTNDGTTHTGYYVDATGNIVSGPGVKNWGEYTAKTSVNAWVRTGDVLDPTKVADLQTNVINVQGILADNSAYQGMMDDVWQTVVQGNADGSVVVGIDRDGIMRIAALLEQPGVPAMLDDYLWAAVTEKGDLVFGYHFDLGWVDATGALNVAGFNGLSSGGKSQVFALVNDKTIAPVTFGENDALYAKVSGGNLFYAEKLNGSLVAKTEDVLAKTSLLSSVSALSHHLVYGQSLSIGGGGLAVPTLTTTPVRPGRAVTFNVGPITQGGADPNNIVPDSNRLSLVDLREGGWETPCSMMGYELTKAGGLPIATGAIVTDHGRGGTAYSGLKKGTQPYANMIASVRRARIIAALHGFDYRASTISWIQGENNTADSLPVYAAHLVELQSDLTNDLAVYTGRNDQVLLFGDQISNWTIYSHIATCDVPLAQLQASFDNAGKIFCVCPKYFLPTVADGIHLTAASSAKLGAYHGRAVRQTLGGTPWVPLYIASAVRTGANIVLTFAGGDLGTDISIDTALVTDPGNRGFEWFQTGGTARTISNVTKTGTRQITIALSGDPGSPTSQQVGYARTGAVDANAGPTTGPRGNIRDNSADLTSYGDPMYNWACHQLVTVA